MRASLWPGLLKAALENQRRQQDRVRLFERGAVFLQTAAQCAKSLRVAGIAAGCALPGAVGRVAATRVDFFDLKARRRGAAGAGRRLA